MLDTFWSVGHCAILKLPQIQRRKITNAQEIGTRAYQNYDHTSTFAGDRARSSSCEILDGLRGRLSSVYSGLLEYCISFSTHFLETPWTITLIKEQWQGRDS